MMKKNSERNAAIRFMKKLFILFIPFIALLAVYFLDDPFMVLKNYERYDQTPVVLNEGHVGWQMYLNNRDTIPIDSYIMGNSCTMAYQCHEWEKYLHGGRAVRLFGNAESLAAVCLKLKALDKAGATIKNLLLIIDKESLHNDRCLTGHSNILPPAISGISSFKFQKEFCQAFFYPNFLFPYLDYKLFHTYRPYMKGVINPYGSTRNPVTNDVLNPREKMIKEEGDKYWENRKGEFTKEKMKNYRDGKYREAPQVLREKQINLLQEIKWICRKHDTDVKIIISPDYLQVNINPADVKTLKRFFGKRNVFDFTGINEYTEDIHNYYEPGHYRPALGKRLMERYMNLISCHRTPNLRHLPARERYRNARSSQGRLPHTTRSLHLQGTAFPDALRPAGWL